LTRSTWLRGIARSGLGLILALGCAQIFGIDEACVVDDACGVDTLCTEYCARIRVKCVDTPQYDFQKAECESLCPHFPRAAEAATDDANTFECRLARATSLTGETRDCYAAGRGGQDDCGSNCEAYCSLMQALCPASFADFAPSDASAEADQAACLAECGRLEDLRVYDPSPAGENEIEGKSTVQCRLWHLGAAAIDVAQTGTDVLSPHCRHASGQPPCGAAPAATP
jgi:hypothetical protein